MSDEIEAALEAAEHLIESGVPVFLAKPAKKDGRWNPRGGNGGCGYNLPLGWQSSEPDVTVLARWRKHHDRGDDYALCAVMGHTVDGFDVDPRNGGKASVKSLSGDEGGMPTSYGKARTPNGGVHHLIATLGVRSRDGAWPGVDVKAGIAGEGGHGFLFIAPTKKMTKDGSIGEYKWEKAPDLEGLALLGGRGDGTGHVVRARVEELRNPTWEGESWEGDDYDGLPDALRAIADQALADVVDWWRDRFAEALDWDDTKRDTRGRGWEALSRDWAWTVAMWVACPWSGLTVDQGFTLHDKILPEEIANDEKCAGKFGRADIHKARGMPVAPPPWDGFEFEVIENDVDGNGTGDVIVRRRVDVTNEANAFDWLMSEAGTRGLSGLFRRGGKVVRAQQVGESGYREPRGEKDDDGPAQVWPLERVGLAAMVNLMYRPYRNAYSTSGVKIGETPALFPGSSAGPTDRAVRVCPDMPNIRDLRGITHTPMMSSRGEVIDSPGFHEASGFLYLPSKGLEEVKVPEEPSPTEIRAARSLVLKMIADFPWDSEDDRANYLAMMLTPMMRQMCPPPYKMGVLHAHQAGSGKSLLGYLIRTIHGGVMRGDVPKEEAELRKQISGILHSTTAPVVQFDNVRHLESTLLDGLLTSATWSDRILGATLDASLTNDRLWIATGNNVSLGGDLVRRILWATIDPKGSSPEKRTDFKISNLKGWVVENRAGVVAALLTLIRAWVVAGRPLGGSYGADDYQGWLGSCQGVLEVAGISGEVDAAGTRQVEEAVEVDDWADYLGAIEKAVTEAGEERFPKGVFTSKDLADAMVEPAPEWLDATSARAIGKALMNRRGRWSGGKSVTLVRKTSGQPLKWKIESE